MDKKLILVVDDEPTVRHVLCTFLERKGCTTEAAGSGEEALELLGAAEPDAVLLDIVLPGMNGLALLGLLKQRLPDTEVLLMTSYSSVKTAVEAIRQGAYDYLQKPFQDLEDVWLCLCRALEKRALSLENRALLDQRAELSRTVRSLAATIGDPTDRPSFDGGTQRESGEQGKA